MFQGGNVTELFSTRVLSPAFALIYNDTIQYAETDIRSFLKRTLHDDYTLLFVSLFAVDSRLMCQLDNETLNINAEPLQEYELAVLLWRWSDSNPCRERQSVQLPFDSESDLAKRLENLKREYERPPHCSPQPPKPDDQHFDVARHMMKCCLRSKDEFHRLQELQQSRESDAQNVDVETRENIAQTLTEFKSDFSSTALKESGESSSWSKVFPQIEFALVALTCLQLASDDIQLNLQPAIKKNTWWLILLISIAAGFVLYHCVPTSATMNDFHVPRSLVAIRLLQICLVFFCSRRQVLAIFPKILLFAIFSYAFTMACMSYTGSTMVQNSELVGKCPISASTLLLRLCSCICAPSLFNQNFENCF